MSFIKNASFRLSRELNVGKPKEKKREYRWIKTMTGNPEEPEFVYTARKEEAGIFDFDEAIVFQLYMRRHNSNHRVSVLPPVAAEGRVGG